MRVLVVHNRYVSAVPSGENAVVDEEIAALQDAGVDVVTHLRSSDEITRLSPDLAIRPVYSRDDVREVRKKLAGVDVLHLHNPYPLVSPWVVRLAKGAGVPVVQTVHNYRHGCVAGSHYRDHHVCEDCLGTRTRWPGVAHGCYRGSRAQSVVLTAAELLHTSTWRSVDRYLVLTEFAREMLVRAGLPNERIVVRPNSTPDPGEPSPPGEGLLFVGRLDEEKGARLLYDAWQPGIPLTVIGAGRYEPPPGIRYLGPQPPDVVAAGVGPLPDLVSRERGWLALPTASSLRAVMSSATADPARGAAARTYYLAELTPQRAMETLLAVYREIA